MIWMGLNAVLSLGHEKSPFRHWSKGGFLLREKLSGSAYLWIIGAFAGSSGAQSLKLIVEKTVRPRVIREKSSP